MMNLVQLTLMWLHGGPDSTGKFFYYCVYVCVLVPCGLSLNSSTVSSRSENKDIKRFIYLFFQKKDFNEANSWHAGRGGLHCHPAGRRRYTNTHVSTHNHTIRGGQDIAVVSGSCHTFWCSITLPVLCFTTSYVYPSAQLCVCSFLIVGYLKAFHVSSPYPYTHTHTLVQC